MKIVLCHGVFDLFHSGHLEHLRQAREMGDLLYVSVLSDSFVFKEYGPVYTQDERLAIMRGLKCVDGALLCNDTGPQYLIENLRPNIYVRGSDYKGKAMPEDAVLSACGVEVRYTRSVPPTTGQIVQRILARQACLSS